MVGLDPIGVVLEDLAAGLGSVVAEAVWPLTDDQAKDRLGRVLAFRAGVEELTARLVRSVMDRDLPRLAGASSMRAWLMGTHGVSGPDAGRLVAEGNAHPGDPDGITRTGRTERTRLAWSAGDLSVAVTSPSPVRAGPRGGRCRGPGASPSTGRPVLHPLRAQRDLWQRIKAEPVRPLTRDETRLDRRYQTIHDTYVADVVTAYRNR
jgi:hypothetical protein